MAPIDDPLDDPQRLRALRDVALMDTPPEEVFDQLTRLAARLVDAPIALVSLLDDRRQYLKSIVGLEGPLAEARGFPLSTSICRAVVADQAPLVVRDARVDARLQEHPAVREHGVVAYLGVPLVDPQGHALGTLCVLDAQPRTWSDQEVETLRALAGTVMTTIALRAEARAAARTAGAAAPAAVEREDGGQAVRACAVGYLAALDRYDAAVRGAVGSSDRLTDEEADRRAVAEAFVGLERALDQVAGGSADEPSPVLAAARTYVLAERAREQASADFLARRLGLDEFQIACAAVRAPEHALRQALLETELTG